MKYADYRRWTDRATAWIEGHFAGLRRHPVRAQTRPGEIAARLPKTPPETAEDMDTIFDDFARIVPDGITWWQHPRFFAYFPANAAPASIIAEQLTNAIGSQCMLWQTSPAATEMEQVMIDWLRQGLGLREGFGGVIQDSASSATLCAVLTMRERATGFKANESGLSGRRQLRIYCSKEVHSSIDKAVRVAGIGLENLVKIATDGGYSIRPDALATAIEADSAAGHTPAGVILASGGTSIGAFDRLEPALDVAQRHGLYVHLDAAWAGAAMICPEFRPLWAGANRCDSIVFNPHKWLGANFDCSIQFLANPDEQRHTMGLTPGYLETPQAQDVINYSEWTVPLGRRFRALKLWFLIRAYGLCGLRKRIRNHVAWTAELCERLRAHPDIVITTEPRLALFSFRHIGGDDATAALLQRINDDGRIYLTRTLHEGRCLIRFTAGQFDCTRADVMTACDVITELAARPGQASGL
ncbi:MAG: aspartate aminotransferase family protein [Rhodobacteraceae bacterium]|nr:aspartate aminotransferase family protein [Paracoccaceae bacterium]